MCSLFSPEILQAGVVKRLTWISLTCDGSLYTARRPRTDDDRYDDDDDDDDADDSSLTSVGFACAG